MAEDARGWLFRAPGGLERVEARLSGAAFAPHRHDTYAVGITLNGVQSFDYRGTARHSLPGQLVVLHPDELHDGRAGNGRGFGYRVAYLHPATLQDILAGRPLPFVEGGVSDDPRLAAPIRALLGDFDRALDDFEAQQALHDLALALRDISGGAAVVAMPNASAVARARDYIEAHLGRQVLLDDLARETGHDRWQLCRDFRALLGVSPYRYLVFRRLDHARRRIAVGDPLADVSFASGFADQSHFTRHFRKAFGMTPRAGAAAHDRSGSRGAGGATIGQEMCDG